MFLRAEYPALPNGANRCAHAAIFSHSRQVFLRLSAAVEVERLFHRAFILALLLHTGSFCLAVSCAGWEIIRLDVY